MELSQLLHLRFPGSFQGMQIRTWLQSRQEIGYQMLHSLLIQALGEDHDGNFEIDVLVPACNKLGIFTDSDLSLFSHDPLHERFLPHVRTVTEAGFPRLPWESDMQVITNKNEILYAVENSRFALQPDFQFDQRYYRDSAYKLLPVGVGPLHDLLDQSKVPGYQHFIDRRDCDDRSKMFLAELAKAKRGNFAIGELTFSCYNAAGDMIYRHSLCFSVHKQALPGPYRDFYMFDAQIRDPLRRIWNSPDRVPIYEQGQDHIKIDWIRV